MSHKIFETAQTTATRMVGPERPGGGDRTMIQIDDNRTGAFVQVYPSALRGILVALEEDALPEADDMKYRVLTSCDLDSGRIEARHRVGDRDVTFVLCIERRDDKELEVVLSSEEAYTMVAIRRFDREEVCR